MDTSPEERDPKFRTTLEALFDVAIALPPDERAAFIESKALDAPTLADRLRRLVAAYQELS